MVIGVLLFETAGCRIKGDPGYPGTFNFPVEYGVVEGSYRDLVNGSEEVCERLCRAARKLEKKGVCAIAGDCGLMALYQSEMMKAVHIPVISSSLTLLPLMKRIISPNYSIGILTGHLAMLGMHHLKGIGVDSFDGICIQGMQEEPHFHKVVIKGGAKQQYNLMKQDVLNGVKKLKALCEADKPLGAVLLECSNLAVFGAEVTKEFGVPVFDINTGIYLMHGVWEKPLYKEV